MFRNCGDSVKYFYNKGIDGGGERNYDQVNDLGAAIDVQREELSKHMIYCLFLFNMNLFIKVSGLINLNLLEDVLIYGAKMLLIITLIKSNYLEKVSLHVKSCGKTFHYNTHPKLLGRLQY
ncbi:hypothetical protein GFK82_00491 [Candidatus Steffania adelgidicola]|nr:hypothetical protein GFK82_00491 [Candidatus Steffania adelgidicola]